MIGAYDEWGNVVDMVEHDARVRKNAIDEFIIKAEQERDDILVWDDGDDYYQGIKAGYQYSIEIAEQMKESAENEKNG